MCRFICVTARGPQLSLFPRGYTDFFDAMIKYSDQKVAWERLPYSSRVGGDGEGLVTGREGVVAEARSWQSQLHIGTGRKRIRWVKLQSLRGHSQ